MSGSGFGTDFIKGPTLRLSCLTIIWLCFLEVENARAQEQYRVLPLDFNSDKTQQMMRAYQRSHVHAALDRRLSELELALESPEKIAAYQEKRRQFLHMTFGKMPERTSLNPRVTGTIDQNGYAVEKVLFESEPRYFVSANLYRPEANGPFPGVLLACGHSANGKAYEAYQQAAILLVQNGFVVLCFDPVGQGERRQLIGPKPHAIENPASEHNQLGVAPILLGRTLGSMMVWDGAAHLDYLCSRPEVDPQRIGCTGISGGGNLTSYLMAYDKRIMAAAPGCFITTHRRKNESPGPGDAEQNLFAQIRDGFDHPDFILTRAPKPTLVLAASKDYVPIEGTWEAFRQAKQCYTALGYSDRIDILETNDKHGFSRRMREGVVRFFARWLQGRDIDAFEADNVPVLTDAELQATPDGQVNWLPDARSIFDLFERAEQELSETRPKLSHATVRRVTGIRPVQDLPQPTVERIAGDLPRRMVIHPEDGISLPALYWPGGDQIPILLATGDGMNVTLAGARQLHDEGHPVLILEVRDTGETLTRNWRFFGADFFIGQMLGRSWLAMRTEDLLVAARWLAKETQQGSITLIAADEVSPAGLHAAFLEPQLIGRLMVRGGLTSWQTLMSDRQAHKHIHQAIHGALQYYDLPDLRRQKQ